MKPSTSTEDFLASSQLTQEAMQQLSAANGIGHMMLFYLRVRADDCSLDNDGDMLLFQWGTYDWGTGPTFQINMTRQFLITKSDGDEEMSQLSLTFHYPTDGHTALLGKGNRWCKHPSALKPLRDFIQESAPFKALRDSTSARVALEWSPV